MKTKRSEAERFANKSVLNLLYIG